MTSFLKQYEQDESITYRSELYRVQSNSKSVRIKMPLREAKLLMSFLNYIEQRRDVVFGHLGNSHLGVSPRAFETALSKKVR